MSASLRLWWPAFATSSLLLSGCDQHKPYADAEFTQRQISSLQDRVAELERQAASTKADLRDNQAAIEANTRRAANMIEAEALRAATDRGDCGTEWISMKDAEGNTLRGGTLRKIPCTGKNYSPGR